jgi:DNA-binding winged helix-turn-helix (wHTH) protein
MLYAFGDYELDTQRYELRRAGILVKIEPQVFNVLAYLIQHCDRTVTRQELLEQLWPESFVNEAVLSYCIMAARKSINDSGRTQQSIKTVHGRGFRFVAALQVRDYKMPPDTETLTASETPRLAAQPQPNQALPNAVSYAEAQSISSGSLHGAHILVTVLCATITKAAALTDQLGFDDIQRLRQAFFALAQHLAQQYQGTLRFFGADGVLMLFGMTEACEEPVQRAVLATMELQRCLPALDTDRNLRAPLVIASATRMGLHTGPVAMASLSSDQPMASTTMGETIHLAVWLQYLTEPGTLLISETTMRLIQGERLDAAPRDVRLPGQPHPVKAYILHPSDGDIRAH